MKKLHFAIQYKLFLSLTALSVVIVGSSILLGHSIIRQPSLATTKSLQKVREKILVTPLQATPSATPTVIPSASPLPIGSISPLIKTMYPGQTASVPILMFHYIRPDPGPADPVGRDLSVTPQNFAAEMTYLDARGYTTLTLSELADVREHKALLPKKPVVLTFDDGYRDFYTSAWPILNQHHFKATIFIITGFVEKSQYLTWNMISELDRSGQVEIGDHTVDHPDLVKVSAAKSQAEIDNCKKVLETFLGHPITSFAYPSGRYTNREVMELTQAGFTVAVTTKMGFAHVSDPSLELPRVRVHGAGGLSQLKQKLL